jgi:hypothetical protein
MYQMILIINIRHWNIDILIEISFNIDLLFILWLDNMRILIILSILKIHHNHLISNHIQNLFSFLFHLIIPILIKVNY